MSKKRLTEEFKIEAVKQVTERNRRLASRIGNAKAVTATARKIAVLFYNAMQYGMNYRDPGANH